MSDRRSERHPPRPRFPEVDALRATAILLVVTLHAALAYTRVDIPRLLWGVREPSAGMGFDRFCWWAMGISVPLFFAIAGFLAAMAAEGRGAAGFWRNRVRRVIVPGFSCVPVVLPLCFLAWAVGWLVTGRCTWREVCRLRFLDPAIESSLYGPAHLWFVEYLIPILAAYALSRRGREAAGARRRGRFDNRWLASIGAPIALSAGSAALMLAHRRITGVDAAIDRHNAIFPEPLRLLHFGLFFLVGAALHDLPGSMDRLSRRGPAWLALSAPVFWWRARLLPGDWVAWPEPSLGYSAGVAALGALGSWLGVFGLIGCYRRWLGRPSRVARYLAGASFWVYLVHLPIVGLAQADLVAHPELSHLAKFGLTLALALGLGLTTYEVFVRRTALGRFLDGRPTPKPAAPAPPPALRPRRRVDPAERLRPGRRRRRVKLGTGTGTGPGRRSARR